MIVLSAMKRSWRGCLFQILWKLIDARTSMSKLKNSITCCSPRRWSVEKYSTHSGPTWCGQTSTPCPHVHCHLSGKLCVRHSIYSLSKVVLLPQPTQNIYYQIYVDSPVHRWWDDKEKRCKKRIVIRRFFVPFLNENEFCNWLIYSTQTKMFDYEPSAKV